VIISAGSSQDFGASKYLNVFSANRAFTISSKDEGLNETTVKAGFTYDLEHYNVITVHNRGADDLDIDFEMSDLRMITGSNAGVEILNAPTIEKINQPISVTAEATVENGTMHMILGASIAEQADKTIDATSSKELLGANPNRKKAIIQIISDTRTGLRFGGATIAAGRGVYAAGSKANPAMYIEESTGAIHAYNEDDAQAKVTITEVLT